MGQKEDDVLMQRGVQVEDALTAEDNLFFLFELFRVRRESSPKLNHFLIGEIG